MAIWPVVDVHSRRRIDVKKVYSAGGHSAELPMDRKRWM